MMHHHKCLKKQLLLILVIPQFLWRRFQVKQGGSGLERKRNKKSHNKLHVLLVIKTSLFFLSFSSCVCFANNIYCLCLLLARGTSADVERAEVPIADAEIILKQISTRMRLLESIIEQVHKLLSNVLGPPPSAAKALKKQRSWKQVRGDYEQAEMLHDLNQQVQQEMPRMDIPGNQASDNSNEEDTLYD